MAKDAKTRKKPRREFDELSGRERMVIDFSAIKYMSDESADKLPMPAEFRGMIGRGKSRTTARLRKRWVGIGWTDEGGADGSEPLLILDDTVGGS